METSLPSREFTLSSRIIKHFSNTLSDRKRQTKLTLPGGVVNILGPIAEFVGIRPGLRQGKSLTDNRYQRQWSAMMKQGYPGR